MREAVIVSAVRTAVGKAPRGTLRTMRPDDMAATAIRAVVRRVPQVQPADIEDVILGCAMPEAEQGMNMARVAALGAGLPDTVCGQTVNRFCSSGLQTIALAAQQIMAGMGDVLIAGGAESMSMVPMSGNSYAPNPRMVEMHPEVYIGMGLTAENVARRYGITREEQDAFALRSHQKAASAQDAGRFDDEIVPMQFTTTDIGPDGRLRQVQQTFARDEGVRRDTSAEALAALRAVFAANGTVTAGNASQTSDGAAAVMVMSRARADALGVRPLARFVSFAVGGVAPEVMGIGPAVAIPKALRLAGLTIDDIDLVELNEAFAAQALAVAREIGIPLERINVNGGAIALGHPLGCTGAKLTTTLLHEMPRRRARYGMVTMCIGGGMGAAGIFENLQ